MLQPFDRDLKHDARSKLVAIASIDLFGYSRLTEQDEVGTHRALMACRRKILEPAVDLHDGRIVKSTGDGALIEFPAAADAVRAMVKFQREVAAAEAAFPPARQLVFRVGIHLTRTIVDDGDLYGHGVNLAVRLQEAAEPGSIFLSDIVVRHLPAETALILDDIGSRTFKNIRERTRLYQWRNARNRQALEQARSVRAAAAILLASFAASMMPPEMTPPVDWSPPDAGRSLPVDAVGKLDAAGQHHSPVQLQPRDGLVGSDGWLLPFDDLNVDAAGRARLSAVPTVDASQRHLQSRREIAEDAYLQALALYGRHTPADLADAVRELNDVLTLKPDHCDGQALLAAIYWAGWQNRWQVAPGMTALETLNRAHDHLDRTPRPSPFAHVVRSEMLTAGGGHDEAIAEAELAIERWPTQAVGHYAKGQALIFDGRPGEAEPLIRAAIRLDPHSPRYLFGLGLAQFGMERFDQARLTLDRAIRRNAGDDWPFLLIAATHGHLGLKDEARLALGRFDRLSVPRRGWFATQIPYVRSWPFRDQRDRQRLHDGMILAGIPEVVEMAGKASSANLVRAR